MIISGSETELGLMNEAGPVVVATSHIADQYFRSVTLVPSYLGSNGLLTSICTSVLVSGSTAKRKLNEGHIVILDIRAVS
ncbi:Methionine aminopeptidase 1 [compost metagenome]